jgi:tripartite-type tricarboxylate transporter receptor subunit TctC
MKLSRRQFLYLAASTIALPAASYKAWAQTYPTRPVRMIVPFGPGGGTDIVARLIGQWLTERLGQTFVIENRPGAGGNLGTEAVVRAPPDGYTLALIGAPSAINATLYDNLTFNFIRDIAPVAIIVRFPNLMVVNPSVPAKTVPEFIAYAKAPDLPTVAEFVPGYEATAWFGAGAPRTTPVEIVDKLNRDINACLVDPKLRARIVDLGGIAITGSPADFGRLIVEETEKWAKVVKFSGAKAE